MRASLVLCAMVAASRRRLSGAADHRPRDLRLVHRRGGLSAARRASAAHSKIARAGPDPAGHHRRHLGSRLSGGLGLWPRRPVAPQITPRVSRRFTRRRPIGSMGTACPRIPRWRRASIPPGSPAWCGKSAERARARCPSSSSPLPSRCWPCSKSMSSATASTGLRARKCARRCCRPRRKFPQNFKNICWCAAR